MEIFGILLVTIIPTSLFIFYVSKYIRPISRAVAPLPPGKLGLPILGELMEFLSNLTSPERFIQERITRHASSTFKTSLLGEPMVVMYGAKGNKFVFANEGKLVRLWWPKTIHTLFPSTMSKEFRVKELAYSYLNPDGLQKYVGIMDSMARKHLKAKWHGQQQAKQQDDFFEQRRVLKTTIWGIEDSKATPAIEGGKDEGASIGVFFVAAIIPWYDSSLSVSD